MDEAVRRLRSDPAAADFVRDAYLSEDVREAAERFALSAEFAAVRELLGNRIADATVVDVGAGNGIAAWAFAQTGAARIYAVDPNPSDVVGLGALRRWLDDARIVPIQGTGESMPLDDESAEIVYARQVLHHAASLPDFTREIARVLRPRGVLLATREHVAETEEQLQTFLASHDLHPLVGGEHAYPLAEYVGALTDAGLVVERVLSPWDTVINAFPVARSQAEVDDRARRALVARLGAAGAALARVPGVEALARTRLDRRRGGEMFSFLATKPTA